MSSKWEPIPRSKAEFFEACRSVHNEGLSIGVCHYDDSASGPGCFIVLKGRSLITRLYKIQGRAGDFPPDIEGEVRYERQRQKFERWLAEFMKGGE